MRIMLHLSKNQNPYALMKKIRMTNTLVVIQRRQTQLTPHRRWFQNHQNPNTCKWGSSRTKYHSNAKALTGRGWADKYYGFSDLLKIPLKSILQIDGNFSLGCKYARFTFWGLAVRAHSLHRPINQIILTLYATFWRSTIHKKRITSCEKGDENLCIEYLSFLTKRTLFHEDTRIQT